MAWDVEKIRFSPMPLSNSVDQQPEYSTAFTVPREAQKVDWHCNNQNVYHVFADRFAINTITWLLKLSRYEHAFNITVPLWGNLPITGWFPSQRDSDTELWCFLWSRIHWTWTNIRVTCGLKRYDGSLNTSFLNGLFWKINLLFLI